MTNDDERIEYKEDVFVTQLINEITPHIFIIRMARPRIGTHGTVAQHNDWVTRAMTAENNIHAAVHRAVRKHTDSLVETIKKIEGRGRGEVQGQEDSQGS